MNMQRVTTKSISASEPAPKVLRCIYFRLPVLNTCGCILEIREPDACNITLWCPPERGAGAVNACHASLADAGLHFGPSLLPRVANATFAKGRF